MPVKKTPTREKKKKILPVKRNILPVKKYKNSAREKKSVREKNRKKCAWKTLFAREKNPKNQKNGFHGYFFFHDQKNESLAFKIRICNRRFEILKVFYPPEGLCGAEPERGPIVFTSHFIGVGRGTGSFKF